MSELAKRAATGAVYVTATLGSAFAGPVTTALLFFPVCLLAAREYHLLAWRGKRSAPGPAFPMITAAITYAAVVAMALLDQWVQFTVPVALLAVVVLSLWEILGRNAEDPARELGVLMAAMLYVAVPFGLTVHLMSDGPALLVGAFIMLWVNDTGAYLVGRAWGRTKLLPRVSPKKTVEGLFGGVLLTVVVALALAWAWPVLSTVGWVSCAVVVATLATLGDLFESALKRAAGVKDSGKLLPGHGGILDRFDGFLLAMPGMLVCAQLMR